MDNSNNNLLQGSQPITINTDRNKQGSFNSWSGFYGSLPSGKNNNYGMFATSPPPKMTNFSPPSPISSIGSQASIDSSANPNHPIRRRMSLNIGASSLATPFFQLPTKDNSNNQSRQNNTSSEAYPSTNEFSTPQPICDGTRRVRKGRTYSTSEVDTMHLAEKWGFNLRSKSTTDCPKVANPFSDKPWLDAAEKIPGRPASPMRDMILEGRFLD